MDTALELFAAAQTAVSADSIYAQRLALIDDYLEALRSKSEQLGKKRGPVPKLRMVWDAEDIVIDGKLDDEYWQKCPTAATGRLRELQTGRQPIFGTSVKSGWKGGNLYFAIRCDEHPGEELNIGTTKQGDQAIWYGDVVEILLETDSHCYYQIAVNPAGALVDLDRGAAKNAWYRWESQAEVATHVADDHWTVEIRIPVTDDENDPLNQVIGRKPTQPAVAHQPLPPADSRERLGVLRLLADRDEELSRADEVRSFLRRKVEAVRPDRTRRRLPSCPQTSRWLVSCRSSWRILNRIRRTGQPRGTDRFPEVRRASASRHGRTGTQGLRPSCGMLADQAPIEAVAKTIRMQNLLAQRKTAELIEQFGKEDLTVWPFWNAGEAYFTRGRAYVSAAVGKKAEVDLTEALKFTSDSRTRLSILRTIGSNRETNLNDDLAALRTYQQIANGTTNNGSAEYFYGVQGAARILTKQGKFDDALATLRLVNLDRLQGSWRGSMRLALAKTLIAAGRNDQALTVYRQISADDAATPQHRKTAQQAIETIEVTVHPDPGKK